nr:MAG TPA: hypothetical protein [Caudoviricetes sp.]
MPNYINDEKMVYDLDLHKYILTPDAVSQDLNINLYDLFKNSQDPDNDIRVFLRRLSIELYSIIYKFNIQYKDIKEYIISLPKYRTGILLSLEEYLYALSKNGTDPNVFFRANDMNYIITKNPKKNYLYTKPIPDSVQMLLDEYGLSWSGKYTYGSYPWNFLDLKGIEY